jgi:two-component system, chemotaxis family, chemotaxis protein CheY
MAEGLAAISVLVVDDNRQMRTIVGTVLTAAGVGRIHYAPDGREALKILTGNSIDVIYVDYEMPRMNGLDFISAVRANEGPMRFLPIIMLTGYSDLTRAQAALDRGVNEFLRKPVTAKDILSRLEAVILRPRPLVHSPVYIGPDRRRRAAGKEGRRRRASDQESASE